MSERIHLWNELRNIKSTHVHSQTPWVVLGDFNEILNSMEHSNGVVNASTRIGMDHFQSMVEDCLLQDLPFSGPQFTWWNKQTDNPIAKKLDRALVNVEWLTEFPYSSANFAPVGYSDHSRCFIKTSGQTDHKRRPFRFFNFLTENPYFLQVIETNWPSPEEIVPSSNALFQLQHKLKAMKFHLRQLNKTQYGDITSKTSEALLTLQQCQQATLLNPSSDNVANEQRASQIWNHFARMEEKFFRQKARIIWLTSGDLNTSFFHNSMKARAGYNMINSITSSEGTVLSEYTEIATEAIPLQENSCIGSSKSMASNIRP